MNALANFNCSEMRLLANQMISGPEWDQMLTNLFSPHYSDGIHNL